VRRAVEEAPVLIIAGVQFTDLNSGFFTQQISRERTIELSALQASVGHALFEPITLPRALKAITEIVRIRAGGRSPSSAAAPPHAPPPPLTDEQRSAELDQTSLWQGVADQLRPGDIVLADQGTSFYGMATHRLRGTSSSSDNRCGPRSATRCRHCWAPVSPRRVAGASCWSATGRR
jgi:alpha-keto-acid decarboxylase